MGLLGGAKQQPGMRLLWLSLYILKRLSYLLCSVSTNQSTQSGPIFPLKDFSILLRYSIVNCITLPESWRFALKDEKQNVIIDKMWTVICYILMLKQHGLIQSPRHHDKSIGLTTAASTYQPTALAPLHILPITSHGPSYWVLTRSQIIEHGRLVSTNHGPNMSISTQENYLNSLRAQVLVCYLIYMLCLFVISSFPWQTWKDIAQRNSLHLQMHNHSSEAAASTFWRHWKPEICIHFSERKVCWNNTNRCPDEVLET